MDILLHTNLLAFLGLGLVGGLLGILATIFWLWMLIDAILSSRYRGVEKLIWVLVVLFLHFIGALIYFFIGRGGARSGPVV